MPYACSQSFRSLTLGVRCVFLGKQGVLPSAEDNAVSPYEHWLQKASLCKFDMRNRILVETAARLILAAAIFLCVPDRGARAGTVHEHSVELTASVTDD